MEEKMETTFEGVGLRFKLYGFRFGVQGWGFTSSCSSAAEGFLGVQ